MFSGVACPKCGKAVASWRSLTEHLRRSRCCADPGRFPCGGCGKGFPVPSVLARHLRAPRGCASRRRSSELRRIVDHCEQTKDESDGKTQEGHCQPVLDFEEADDTLRSAVGLKSATLNKAEEYDRTDANNSMRCPKCLKSFPKRQHLARHLITSQSCGKAEAQYICSVCGAAFPLKHTLTAHIRSPKACGIKIRRDELARIFGSTRSTQEELTADQKAQLTNQIEARPTEDASTGCLPKSTSHRCPKCEVNYAQRDSLVQHLDYSKSCGGKAKPFACASCEASFPQRSGLATHIAGSGCEARQRRSFLRSLVNVDLSHQKTSQDTAGPRPVIEATKAAKPAPLSNSDPLTCAKCSKSFKSKEVHRQHAAYSRSCGEATGRFACPKCAAAFHVASHLARHLSRPIGCEMRLKQKEFRALIKAAADEATGAEG